MIDHPERRDLELLKAEVTAAGTTFKGNECRCPFHEDKRASAGVYVDGEGVARFKCHGCDASGDVYDIRARIKGVPVADVLPKGERFPKKVATITTPASKVYDSLEDIIRVASVNCGAWVKTYPYPDKSVVLRFNPKSFRQAHKNCVGWLFTAPPKPWALYGLHSLGCFECDTIVCEGEEDCDNLHALGLPAVTSRGGAMNARHSDWTPLAGRSCVLWPDADPPDPPKYPQGKGLAHMVEVGDIPTKIGVTVRIVDVSRLELPPKGDASDYLERYTD